MKRLNASNACQGAKFGYYTLGEVMVCRVKLLGARARAPQNEARSSFPCLLRFATASIPRPLLCLHRNRDISISVYENTKVAYLTAHCGGWNGVNSVDLDADEHARSETALSLWVYTANNWGIAKDLEHTAGMAAVPAEDLIIYCTQ